jgi:hypothetical protein
MHCAACGPPLPPVAALLLISRLLLLLLGAGHDVVLQLHEVPAQMA